MVKTDLQAGQFAATALKQRLIQPVMADIMVKPKLKAGFDLPVAEQHPRAAEAVSDVVAVAIPVETIGVKAAVIVAPAIAVIQQPIAIRHADARLEILRIAPVAESAAAAAANEPAIGNTQQVVTHQRGRKLTDAGASLAAIVHIQPQDQRKLGCAGQVDNGIARLSRRDDFNLNRRSTKPVYLLHSLFNIT